MFEAEFTHEGDRCTLRGAARSRRGLDDPALRAIAEIVHDIDLKDGKFGREEAAGITTLIAGIAMTTPTMTGAPRARRRVFDNLYRVLPQEAQHERTP